MGDCHLRNDERKERLSGQEKVRKYLFLFSSVDWIGSVMHRGEGLLLYHLVNSVKPFVVKMHWSSNLRYPQLSLLQPYPVSICKKKTFCVPPQKV
jgi:hypothetical protein